MKIKEQTRKLAAGCSKQCFEVADGSWHSLKRLSKSITRIMSTSNRFAHKKKP